MVKRFSKLVEQAGFDTFQHMVACKVFDEAQFLTGNHELHEAGRRLLAERNVIDRLRDLEAQAAVRRAERERYSARGPSVMSCPDDGASALLQP